jgi:hypothetical protein
MSTPLLLEGTLPRRGRRGAAQAATVSMSSPRVPRIARLVALAWHIEEQVRLGTLASYAAAARLGHVSRARLSQIVSLLNLAPDLQEQVLFLRRPIRGRQAPTLRQLLSVAAALDWHEQRRRWRKLRRPKPAGA